METENKIAEAATMESEGEKRSITGELLDPIPNKFYSEESEKSLGMQDLPAEITELLINAENVQSSSDPEESTSADTKHIDRAAEGKKFLEPSSEAAIVKKEDSKQLQRAEILETDDRTTDEEKHFQEEKGGQDYVTDDVKSAISHFAKTVEANFNIIEEQRTEEVLDKNVDTGCGPKFDCTDNVVNMDPTFVLQNVGENIFDVQSKVLEKLLDLPAEQKAPESQDICKQTVNEQVEIDKVIHSGARDSSVAAVAESSDTQKDDKELNLISDEGGKNTDESSTIVALDNSTKNNHDVDPVELKETTSTESQDMTELNAERKYVMPEGENEENKSNSLRSAVIIEPVAHSSHQIDEEAAHKMDAEEANDMTPETISQAVQNSMAEEEDGMDRKEILDGSSAKHTESIQRDYSNSFGTDASEGERNDGGYLTGEVVMDGSGQGINDADDHIAKEMSSVKAESEGSFLQQSLPGDEQPEFNSEVLEKELSCIKEEVHSQIPHKVDEDDSVYDRPNDEESQENSPQNPEGDKQRSDAADLEIQCEKVTGKGEACKPKEIKTEDGSEGCKSTEFQHAWKPSREGHDPEDVAADMLASGDIYSAESVTDELLQPTLEPEIVLETAPTCRTEHESCCGEKEKATDEDEDKELTAESCNTMDLTEETIRTILSENSPKENECEIKLSEESKPAGADRNLEDDTHQDNESSEIQIAPPMQGGMTQEVEGKEKGTSVVILADDSIINGLDNVLEKASMPEKYYYDTVNKNEGANEFKRSFNEIPEPTEADNTNSPKMDGTILRHEELSANGNNENNVKNKENEIDKNYEQTGRSSTTEGLAEPILLRANKKTGESAGPDLIEEDPVQERTIEAIVHREENVTGCQINPSTEEAMDYVENFTEETNAARDFEVLAEGISEGRPSKDDREQENKEQVHMRLAPITSCEETEDCEQEEDAKSKLSVDEQETKNQKSKFMSDAISLKEEGKDENDFTEQVEAARSIENTAKTEKDNTDTCNKIQSTSIDEFSEETLPKEHDEYHRSDSSCAPSETNPDVSEAAERLEVRSANGSQAARVSPIEDGVPDNANESEAKDNAGTTDIASGVDELPVLAKQERKLANTDSNVKEDDLTDSGQEKGESSASVDATKESAVSEILDKEPTDSKDLGTSEKPAVYTFKGSLCSILKAEAGEEKCEAPTESEGTDKNEERPHGTHSSEGFMMPHKDESTKTLSDSEEVETAKGSALKEVSEDLQVPTEVHFADLNIAEGIHISATNGTGETENHQVDQHNAISDGRSINPHLEMKENEGEIHDEALKHQESSAPETDIKNRTLEEKVSTENVEDNLKEYYATDKAAFRSEVSAPIGEERGADTISTQNLKTMELTEQTETMNMDIGEHSITERETCTMGEVEEEVQYQEKVDLDGLVITPIETVREDTIKESDGAINRDIAAAEIEREEVRPQKKQLDDRPNMASGICSEMGPPERTESDPGKHDEEVDQTMCYEISTNLLPRSSESDSKVGEREVTIVENPTITEEEIELPSDKKGETRASDAQESTETKNYSSFQNTDAEETIKHEEISETSASQNGEAAEDGGAIDWTVPCESTLELLAQAAESLTEEKKNGPKTAGEKIKDDNEEEVEMQSNESQLLSSGTVQTEEACFDKKETNKYGVSKISSDDYEGEKDTPNGQKDGCTHGDEVLKVNTKEVESKTRNPDSPEVDDKTAEVSVITEEASSFGSSKSENVHEVMPDVQTSESSTRLEDVDLKSMKVEGTITDVKPEQKCEDAIEANDMSQNVASNEAVLHEKIQMEESQNDEELETGEVDKNLLPKSCKIGEMKAIDQAEQAQTGNADNREIQISKIEHDDKRISTSKTEDATKDIGKEVVKETAILDDFNTMTTAAVETAEIGIPAKKSSGGVFNENVHEVVSDAKENGSSIESDHDIMEGMKVEAVTADVELEEKCQDAIGANDKSKSGLTKEGVQDENKRLEETQNGEDCENGEGDNTIREKKDFFGPILAEDTEEIDQDEKAQAGNLDEEQICDEGKDSVSVSKNEDPTKDFVEIIKRTNTLDELNATSIATVETAAQISIRRDEASGVMFRIGEHIPEVMSDVQTTASTKGSEDAEMNAMKVEAFTADVEPAEKCEDGIEEIDMSRIAITNEGMTDAHTKAPLLESCNISEKEDFSKAPSEVSEATHQIELAKEGHADNEEIQTSESKIHDRLKDGVSVTKTEDEVQDVEKEVITEAGTKDEFNATTFIAVPETTEIKVPTEEASGFVLSKSENTLEVDLDVQADERSMGLEDAEMKGMHVEEVMADGKPEEKHQDAFEANDKSQNAITSARVLESHRKADGEENETGEGDNASVLGYKINEKKDCGPVVAEDTEATDEVEKAESENADNEEIQTSKSKRDDKLEDSVLVWKAADESIDAGEKTIEEIDTPDQFNATTIAAAEREIAMLEHQEEETPIGTSTLPPDSVTVQNSNADDFERIRMVSESSHDTNSTYDETIDGTEKTSMNEKLGLVENEVELEGTASSLIVSKTDQGKTVLKEEITADQSLPAKNHEALIQTPLFASLPLGGEEKLEKLGNIKGNDKLAGEMELLDAECLERGEPRNIGVTELAISANESTLDINEDEKGQSTHGEALKAASKEREKDTEFTNNVEKEMQNELEKADGSQQINEQETMNDVDSKETHETTPGNSIINQDMHTGSISAEEITHCNEQTDSENPETEKNLSRKSESYATVALEEENMLNGCGACIAQTKDAPQDFDVTKEIKEEIGSCYDKTDIAAMASLRTETGMPTIQQDDKPVEAFPGDLEGPSPEETEPGLILSGKNFDKKNLQGTSSTSFCQLSDTEKENANIQNPDASESGTNVVGENDSLLFLAEEGGEEAIVDEKFREKSLDGEMVQINENIDVTEVCCKKADSIKHADTQIEIQADQVAKNTSCEEDKEGNNLVENLKLELPEEESGRRSARSTSADQGNMGTQVHEISAAHDDIKVTYSKAAADDLEPEKHSDIATEAADTLIGEILHKEVFNRPQDADECENLTKEHQVEENFNPNQTVPMSPRNCAICEEADSNAVSEEHVEALYSTDKTRGGNSDVEQISESMQIQEVLNQEKTQEEENRVSLAPTKHETKDSEKLTKDPDTCHYMVDTVPRTSLTSTPISCMTPKEEKPVDDSDTGFDKELPKEAELEASLEEGNIETQLEEKHLAADDVNVERENMTAENLKADELGRLTVASQAVLVSKDLGKDIVDAIEETTAEELDVIDCRSHCLELVQEPDAPSDQKTSSRELKVQIQIPFSALLQEEPKDELISSTRAIEGKQDTQTVQETETLLCSSAAEAKEGIRQMENTGFEPPKDCSRGGESIQDDLAEKYDERCSTEEEGLEPEIQNKTKCIDVPSDSEKIVCLSSATESHDRGDIDDLVKSASQVNIQEDLKEPEDTGVEENQVCALAQDLKAEEKRVETSKENETLQDENAKGQIVERLEDFNSNPINQEISKGSLGEDELHHENIVKEEIHETLHSKASELQYQQEKSKHSAVDEDISLEEFDKVHVERETVDINSIDRAERNITSESGHQTNSESSTTDATTICNKGSIVEKTQEADDLGLQEARDTNPVLEQKEYASIAKPEMPVSGEACLTMAPDVILIEGNEDRSPLAKKIIVGTIQNPKASNMELGDPLEADLEPKGIEYGGERTCSSDAKTSEEDMSKDTSVVSVGDLLNKTPEGKSPTTEPSTGERRPTDELDTVPPEEVKGDEHEDDEHERTEPGHDAPVMVEDSKDIDVKVPHKKSHSILSGVGSKVKHSISKVKKAITGKSSHSKAHPAK